MCRMKNNRLALEALPQVSTHQRLFFSVLYKRALPKIGRNCCDALYSSEGVADFEYPDAAGVGRSDDVVIFSKSEGTDDF